MILSSSPNFRVFGGRGFQMTFGNGVTASVMFGPGNYCSAGGFGFMGDVHQHECRDAEVRAWDAKGKDLIVLTDVDPRDGEVLGVRNVVGHLHPDKVAAFIAAVAAHSGDDKLAFDFNK